MAVFAMAISTFQFQGLLLTEISFSKFDSVDYSSLTVIIYATMTQGAKFTYCMALYELLNRIKSEFAHVDLKEISS